MAISTSVARDIGAVPGASLELEVPTAPLLTIRTGGLAAGLVTVEDADAAAGVIGILQSHGVPTYCLGAGSDLLVADEGYPGVVLQLGDGLARVEDMWDVPSGQAEHVVTVGAGFLLADLAAMAAEVGLAGLEFACGIPGSVGGGVATNAGAYGRALADVLSEVQLASAEGTRWTPAGDLEWEYRHCRLPQGVVATAARFRFERDEPAAILERHRSILEMRRAVQPQGVATFGSTFKNPSGGAAGRLLDAAGVKGERRGDAEVSKVHANFVVNLGEATTADVLALMSHMRKRAHETSGVVLEPEVRLLGTDFPWESPAGGDRQYPPADG